METIGLTDIIGPIMVGPSSSHTAGALRIASMARGLCLDAPVRVEFSLLGSFAHTLSGHGTDKALVAGMLGLTADDLRIRDSFTLAEQAGLSFSFHPLPDSDDYDHPNTIDIRATDAAGNEMSVRGESVGGGAAVIRRIDGIEVYVTGESTSVVVRQRDVAGVLAHIARSLGDRGVNIATRAHVPRAARPGGLHRAGDRPRRGRACQGSHREPSRRARRARHTRHRLRPGAKHAGRVRGCSS